MAEREILIRRAVVEDMESIFYLYSNFIFDSFFLKFSRPLVKKYLGRIIESRECITLAAGGEKPIGFIMSSFGADKLFSSLFFDPSNLKIFLGSILKNPKIFGEALSFLSYPSKTSLKGVSAEMLFIAVDPAFRKQGLAARLIEKTLESMRQKGIGRVKVSAIADNKAVNALLEGLGFLIEKKFRIAKKEMLLYSLKI